MSLYWRNKDKARSCERCDFSRRIPRSDGQILFCYAANKFVEKTEGISDYINYEECPFGEIATPHGRLIDADAHIQSLKDNQCGERCRKNYDCVNCGIGMYIRIVENEPTILEAEK